MIKLNFFSSTVLTGFLKVQHSTLVGFTARSPPRYNKASVMEALGDRALIKSILEQASQLSIKWMLDHDGFSAVRTG